MYIDTHCHLNFKDFDKDRDAVIHNAQKSGVKKFLIPGNSVHTSNSAALIASTHKDCIFASVGCHPYETMRHPDINELERCITKNTIGIGECGLDFHPYDGFDALGKKQEQKQLFEAQLLLALKYDLPVIIHSRDAGDEIFSVLDLLPTQPKGVFHCISGGLEYVREIERRGYYFGIDGNVTYSKQLALIVPFIPLKKIVLETDAPYLPPVPYRGKRSEPKYIPLIAQKIAELKNCSVENVETITTKNALELFHFDD